MKNKEEAKHAIMFGLLQCVEISAMLKPGDMIDDGTLLCTIKRIYYQDGYDGHWKVEFEDTDGLYPASVDKLIEKYSGSAATWQSNREYLAAIGLIKVRKPGKDTESKALQESARRAKEGRRAVNWYAIPDYTPDLFKTAEQAAERFKAKGINRKGLTKQGLIIAAGPAQANKTVIDWRSRSKQDKAAEREIIRQIKMAISRKGYAMKENILKRSAKRTATAKKVDFVEALYYVWNLWANRNKRLLSMAGARYHRPTRAEKERFNLKGDNWIITVEGEVF